MIHAEALEFKRNIGEVFIEKEFEFNVIVAPNLDSDFKNYLEDLVLMIIYLLNTLLILISRFVDYVNMKVFYY